MKLILKYRFIIASSLIAFISASSLLSPGLPPTHDGEYHVMRFQEFYKVLNEGVLYPRWAPDFNNGYGIPLFNYVYPLPNYVASLLHFLGFSFIESFKLNLILATIVGSVFFYLWTEKYWGKIGGLVSSVFYAFSPYHLLDIYVRGSVGEVWSLGLFPGLLWAYQKFFETKKILFFIFSVLLLALLIFSHNILALIFFIFFIFYSAFLILNKKSKSQVILGDLKDLGLISVLGLGSSSIFWLPAILETNYVRGLQIFDPTMHFPKLYSLIYSSWGYGFSGQGVSDQMSFQIGIANLIVVGASLLGFKYIKSKKIILFFLASFIITLFLITPFSSFVWKNLTFLSYIQFPWRLLSLIIVLSSFLAGFLVSDLLFKDKQKKILLAILLIFLSVGLSLKYSRAPFHHQRDDQHYFSRSNFTDGTNSPGNVFNTAQFNPKLEKSNLRLSGEKSDIKILGNKSTKINARVKSQEEDIIFANIAYFPGWEVRVDNREVPININKDGLFEFTVPPGESIVEVELKNTKIRLISVVLTIFSFSVLFGLFVRDKYIRIK